MEITEDLLEIILTRAGEYATTKYGKKPDYIKAYSDENCLYAIYDVGCCGSYEEESELITAENLTEDLDVVVEERRKQVEEQRVKLEIYYAQQKKEREERELKNRKAEYEKLKKEFEK